LIARGAGRHIIVAVARDGLASDGVRAATRVARGRFAPSPTGELHLGNARTAVLAWLWAKHARGVFTLRIEDLDRSRERPGLAERQLAELRWLGLGWDEGPDPEGNSASCRSA